MARRTGATLHLHDEEVGLLRACFRHGHAHFTPPARAELRMIEAKVNAAVGGNPHWTEQFAPPPAPFTLDGYEVAKAVGRHAAGGCDDYVGPT